MVKIMHWNFTIVKSDRHYYFLGLYNGIFNRDVIAQYATILHVRIIIFNICLIFIPELVLFRTAVGENIYP